MNSNEVVEARRAYQKKWRANNKERVREYNRRFWEKQAEKQNVTNESTKKEN